MSQIGGIEPPPELCGERRSQCLQQPGSIFRPCRAALFELDDMSAYLPAGLYLDGIDSPKCPLTSVLDQVAKTVKKLGRPFVGFDRFA